LGVSVFQLLKDCPLPRHEAWALWVAASGQSKTYWVAHDDLPAPVPARALFAHWVQLRQVGRPLAYLVGWREFYGRPFWVNRHTLIPRSDTELLIDTAIALLNAPSNQQQPKKVCDLGTGSGCIAITLALECPGIEVTATDISSAAIAAARNNAAWLGVSDRLNFVQGSWLESSWLESSLLGEPLFKGAACQSGNSLFDAIISNPPYIAPNDPHLLQGDLPFEPITALTPQCQNQGLGAIFSIVDQALKRLKPGGFLLIEHGYDQQQAVIARFDQAGLGGVKPLQDLTGLPRAVLGFAI
jgi:release factor glutamine methyltransferase